MSHTFTQRETDWGYMQFMELEGEAVQEGGRCRGAVQGAGSGPAGWLLRWFAPGLRSTAAESRRPALPAVLRNTPGFISHNLVLFRVRFLQDAAAAAAGAAAGAPAAAAQG